jgi:2-polyprenyl-3-methyl-5-hydroxy-6-metoxy-1,4-benzoquinol methylase
MKKALQKNIEYSDKYHQSVKKVEIPGMIKDILEKKRLSKIIDLGCGDGGLILSILKNYENKKITGVDASPRRILDLKKKIKGQKFLCRDISSMNLGKNKFDLVICTQVIEHVEDDRKLVDEIFKILKPKGYLYISSVIKKPFAIYKYRRRGKFVLDPTHEREYGSKEEFIHLFKEKFKIRKLKVYPVERKKFFAFQIPGYYIIETLWEK